MKRRASWIVATSVVVLALQVGAPGAHDQRVVPWAAWAESCGFSHRNQDDAIVLPRQPGRSHDHTYFGNHSTNAFSSPASLRRSERTTCGARGDKAAYWTPTLFVRGRAVEPLGMVAQYVRRTREPVDPIPAGLKMIAGNMNARAPQPERTTSWSCARNDSPRRSTMPTCTGTRSGGLVLRVAFPDCWDGRRLDSPNHMRHMGYSVDGVCPETRPVELPALTLFFFYGVRGGRSTELASGGQFSGHADFVNAWNQARLAGIVHRYLNDPDVSVPPGEPPDPTNPRGPCERCPRP